LIFEEEAIRLPLNLIASTLPNTVTIFIQPC